MSGSRRFLLTGVVSRYQYEASWNREELAADLGRMVGLFTGELGYEHVPLMGLNPTQRQVEDALRDFSMDSSRQPEDYVAVYLAGHGDVLEVGAAGAEHVLLPADADPSDRYRRVVRTADLARWMLAGTPVHRLLLLLDTCFSGQGGVDFAGNAAAWAGSWGRFDTPGESGVVVVSATQPKQEAVPGAFTGAFERAVRGPAAAGHVPGSLSVDAVVGVMNADPALPPSQRAQVSLVLGNGRMPDFLPNPQQDAALVDLDLAEQSRRWRWRQEEEQRRAEELRGQFVPRIAGFIGRGQALADLSRWLDDPADARPRVVTGDPGSGKTAVLGLLAALSDPLRRPTVSRDGLPPGIVPRAGMIDAAVYAGNLTSGQVLAALAAVAGLEDLDPDPAAFDLGVARLLAGLRERGRPLTVIVDALDEAADPVHLAGRLLRPLIERGQGSVRLLLGTRRHVCVHLGPAWPGSCEAIDLDSHRYADPRSLAEVVRRILRRGAPGQPVASPFASCPPQVLEEAAGAIAAAAGRSFFVARIVAGAQAAQPRLPDVADPAWRAGLPRQAGPAMRQDLEMRLGGQADRAIDLLRPLAYARGPGLPWEDLWALLAGALAPGRGYTNEDLLWLAGSAGSYIVESGTIDDRSLYRLYHRSLTEYLRDGRDQFADEQAITAALAGHVPLRPNGRRDWPAAHPYVRAYLPAHAADGGMIDELSQDPGFLLAADPPQLLNALDRTVGIPALEAADTYRRALPFLRGHEETEHPAYLALAAHCGRAGLLADRITADGLDGPWRPLWASWRLQRPHQLIAGRGGPVYTVAVGELDGRPVAVSGSSDWLMRVWDLATGTPVGTPFTGHDGIVFAVAVGELDGRPVAVSGGGDGSVRVWDLATGSPVGTPFTGHDGIVFAVAVGELDGRPVAVSGGGDGSVRVWDLVTGTPVGTPFTGHGWAVLAVAVAELDGRPVAVSGGDDGTVRVWDLATGTPVGTPFTGHDGPVLAVAVAELDGRPVAVSGGDDGSVRVWDLAAGSPVGTPFTGHDGPVFAVAVAELDGRPVAVSGGDDGSVRVWDLATGTPVGTPFTGHDGTVLAVAVAELDGRPVAVSGSYDETVRVWDLAASSPFTGHSHWVRSAAVAELDGRPVAVSGSGDGSVRVWDLATGSPVGTPFTGHGWPVFAVAVAELDGRPVVVSGGGDRTVRVWDLATGTPVGTSFTGHDGTVNAVAVAELDGRPVAVSGGDDGSVRVWDLATGSPVGTPFTGHDWPVLAVAVAELDGRPVAVSGGDDETVRVWDLATGSPVGTPFTGHDGTVFAVAVGELDGRPVVVSGSGDRTVRVWDLATGTPVGTPFTGHDETVNAVAVGELDGRPVVVSGGDDGTVRVWDLATGTPVGTPFTGHDGIVFAVAVGELDGRPVVVSGSGDRTVRVWDLATGTPVGTPFTGHDGIVNAVAVAELDGRPVAVSGGDDGTVRVWDLATGTPVGAPFTGHDETVNAVAVAELDGRPVAVSGGDDETVRVWDLATGTPVGDPVHRPRRARERGSGGGAGRPPGGGLRRRRRDGAGVGPGHRRPRSATPFTGHDGIVNAVAVGELDGRPVVVSGGDDRTVRVWDLATGTPVGTPFTGHDETVNAVAVAELDGRPVAVSGGYDETVRVWDLATGSAAAESFTCGAAIRSAISTAPDNFNYRQMRGSPVFTVVSAGDRAILLAARTSEDLGAWAAHMTIQFSSEVLSTAWHDPNTLIVATELGIAIIETA